jgi:hypothetical protein
VLFPFQTGHLLQSQKHSAEDIANISSSCFKLNSLQLRVLLQSYIPEHEEGHVPQDLINRLVSMAENTADELIRSEGREVHLEEDPDLHLPFLLPEDGYSCDIVRGIPNGLPEFLDPLINSGKLLFVLTVALQHCSFLLSRNVARSRDCSKPMGFTDTYLRYDITRSFTIRPVTDMLSRQFFHSCSTIPFSIRLTRLSE